MGIINAIKKEFTSRKITFYVIFHGIHIFLFIMGWWAQAANNNLAALNALHFSVWISRGAGMVLTFDMTIILLPMCRNIMTWLRPKARWLPLDETQYFHRQVAYTMLFWVVVHVASHYVNFFNIEQTQVRPVAAVQLHYTEAGGITGHIMLLCMLLMFTTSHSKIRQQSYETFWYTHHLFIPFLLAMYTHATGCFVRDTPEPYSPFAGSPFWQHCYGYEGWRWELIAFALYLVERIYRELRSRRTTEITTVIKHPYDALEIQFRKPSMRYKAGQWLFLNCPSVSPHQWHPFTITSCPFDPYISIHVRQVGDFTRSLADALGAGPHQQKLYDELDPTGLYEVALAAGEQMPQIRIDGPYGAPAEDVFDNEVAVLIGTGIGVTPWAAILKNIWHLRMQQAQAGGATPRLRRVEFIWVAKDTSSFEWFQALLSSLEAQSLADAERPAKSNPNDNTNNVSDTNNTNNTSINTNPSGNSISFLRIHTYLTQRLDLDAATNIILNSVGAPKDPLTELETRMNFGRPDFGRLLKGMRDGILDETYVVGGGGGSRVGVGVGRNGFDKGKKVHVGVYFCGPNAAARDIERACKGADCEGVGFRFWKEHF